MWSTSPDAKRLGVSPTSCQPVQLAIKIGDLSANVISRGQQWSHGIGQDRMIRDQRLDPGAKDLALGLADHQADNLQQTPDLVIEIAFDLDQHCPAGEQRAGAVAVQVCIDSAALA